MHCQTGAINQTSALPIRALPRQRISKQARLPLHVLIILSRKKQLPVKMMHVGKDMSFVIFYLHTCFKLPFG